MWCCVCRPHPPPSQVPASYERRLLADMIDKTTGGMLSSGRARRGRGEDAFVDLDDDMDFL